MIDKLTDTYIRLKTSSLAGRFMRGAAWSVFGSMICSGTTLVMFMFVSRLLGKEVYGQFVIIQSTLSTVGVLAGFGVGAAATRYVAELKLHNTARLGHILTLAERTILGFGLLACSGLVFSANLMATHMLNTPSLSVPLAISAGAVLFSALDSYQKSVLIGFESMRAYAIGTVIGVIVGFPVMLLAAKNFGLQGASVALVINALLQAFISRFQMFRELRKYNVKCETKGCLSEFPVLLHFALPALLSSVLVGPSHWAAQTMLARTSNGYSELAVLGVAMQWFNVIMFVPGTAARVVMPMLTEHVTNDDHSNTRKILLYAMGANAIIALPLAVIIAISSRYIMSLYGKSFEDDSISLILAVMTGALLAILTPVGSLLAASSRMWLGAVMNSGWAFVFVGSAYYLIDKGAAGILLALAFGYLAHTFWVSYFAMRVLWKK